MATEPSNAEKLSHSSPSSEKEIAVGEKSSQDPEHSEHADGELVAIDKAGHVDVIHESDYTEEEYKKLLKKIDRYLLPLMWFCYGIQQTDKIALGTQAIFGLIEDTHLVGSQYSWLTTIFYITYLCGQLPSNFLLQRWSIGKCLSTYMLGWGIVVICTAAAQNWSQLMALRALQGLLECCISPGFIQIVSSWYKTEEHPNRSLWWQSANAGFGIIASLVNYGIGWHAEHAGGIAAWRCISLFLGSATIVLATICFFLLGSPKEVAWLNQEERRMAAARIVRDKRGRDVTGIHWAWPHLLECLRDPVFYIFFLNAFLSSVPNGGFTAFGNLMYSGFGFSNLQVILVDIPRNVLSLVVFLAVALYTRKVPNRRMFIMAGACIPPFVGLVALATLPNSPHYQWTKWAMYFITVPYTLALFLAWTLIASNVAGRTKKTLMTSASFLGYCTGNMCGSQIFSEADAPLYIPGTIGGCICLGLEFMLIMSWRYYYVWQNKKRDRKAAESGVSKEEQERLGRDLGEKDVTDLKNPHFRYTL